MSQLKLYKASDNSLISEAPSESNAVEVVLRGDLTQSASRRLYARLDPGFKTTATNAIILGVNAGKWDIAPDVSGSAGTFVPGGDGLSLGEVTDSPKYFWVRAWAFPDEELHRDVTVTLRVEGIGEAV